MPCIEASKFIPLKTLLEIRTNNYTSYSGKDYYSDSVELRILEKLSTKSDKEASEVHKALEEFEAERLELRALINVLKKSGRKFLGDSLLIENVKQIETQLINYI